MKTSKKVLSIVLSVAMVLSAMVFSISAADFDETWTAITNAAELKAIENDMAGKYYLANDITLNGDWESIGWIGSGDVKSTGSVIPAKGHNDANGDGKCDDCGKDIGGGNTGDDHGNGSHKGFAGLMNWFTRLMILVRHLLGML